MNNNNKETTPGFVYPTWNMFKSEDYTHTELKRNPENVEIKKILPRAACGAVNSDKFSSS